MTQALYGADRATLSVHRDIQFPGYSIIYFHDLSSIYRRISTIFLGNLLRNSYTIDNRPTLPL